MEHLHCEKAGSYLKESLIWESVSLKKHLYLLLDKQLPVISDGDNGAKTGLIPLPIKSGNLKRKYREPLLLLPQQVDSCCWNYISYFKTTQEEFMNWEGCREDS